MPHLRSRFRIKQAAKLIRKMQCLFSIFLPRLSTSHIPSSDGSQPESGKGKGNTNGDWISFLIALGLSQLPFDMDVAVWSRGISLLLTGLLILSSLAQVLRSVSRILRLTSKTVGAGFLLLGLGQLFVSLNLLFLSEPLL